MVRHCLKLKVICSLVLLSYLLSYPCYAEIPFDQSKGVYAATREDQKENSPLWGMASLRSKVLENIRFFGPYNIYSEKTDIFANEQEMQNHLKLLGLWKEPEDPNNLTGFEKPWQQVQDVPQDFISALIQYLFPSPDGAIFVANERRGDPLVDLIRDQSGVNLTRLNHLIETLLVFKKKFSPSTTSKDWEQLKTDIFNILMPPPKEGKKKEGRTKQERVEYFGQRKLEKQKNGIEH